ncbi:speedy protein A [Nilaparvata lugens]|uniref:speedy protein A n=1 Tax=Nilaparvata lugens TaxID=108931 RepID=UPI00193E73FD|nr:speedy protein A [Nilaparvata lugens]
MGNNTSLINFETNEFLKENKLFEEDKHNSEIEVTELKFTREQLNIFIKMFDEDMVLSDFLSFDRCCVLADKYLLATCFIYFVRAGLQPTEYGRMNFFTALYIAHQMEEDDHDLRDSIFPWASAPSPKLKRRPLLRSVRRMWMAMDLRTVVSRYSCQQVIGRFQKADIWSRRRPAHHGNAYRKFKECPNCVPKIDNHILNFYEYEDDIYSCKPKMPRLPLIVPDMSEESSCSSSSSDDDDEISDSQSDDSLDLESLPSSEDGDVDAMDVSHDSDSEGVSKISSTEKLMEVDFFVNSSQGSDVLDENNNCDSVK